MLKRFFGFLVLLFLSAPSFASESLCRDDVVDLRGDWGQARFRVEIADDSDERSLGLMYRKSLPMGQGMLFLYGKPIHAVFWMRNTFIPLDIIFLDQAGTVMRIHRDAVPFDETHIDGGEGVWAVLEVNAGLSDSLGLVEGSQMRHPAFGESAVWPCEGS